jgi:hypothetical protein
MFRGNGDIRAGDPSLHIWLATCSQKVVVAEYKLLMETKEAVTPVKDGGACIGICVMLVEMKVQHVLGVRSDSTTLPRRGEEPINIRNW